MSEFKREPRYVVFKIKDIEKYLTETGQESVMVMGRAIARGRDKDGKPPFNAVVVEQDWPEFEPTWAAIEARVTANVNVTGATQLHRGASVLTAGLAGTGETE